MFGTILLAVDGSKPAEKAVELAASIAKADGDAIVIVHVTERLPYRDVQPPPEGHLEGDQEAIQLAEQYVKDLEAAGLRARVDLPHHVRLRGPPHPRCRQRARRRPDRDGLSWPLRSCRPAAGQRGHKVLHLSACPVLIAR